MLRTYYMLHMYMHKAVEKTRACSYVVPPTVVVRKQGEIFSEGGGRVPASLLRHF